MADAVMLEIIEKKNNTTAHNVSIKLLDTSFKHLVKLVSGVGDSFDTVEEGSVISQNLLQDIINKQEEVNDKYFNYADDIDNYCLRKNLITRVDRPLINSYTSMIQEGEEVDYNLLTAIVETEKKLKQFQLNIVEALNQIREELFLLAGLTLKKAISSDDTIDDLEKCTLHPSLLKLAAIEFNLTKSTTIVSTVPVYVVTYKIYLRVYALDGDYNLDSDNLLYEEELSSGTKQSSDGYEEVEYDGGISFTSLGDALVVGNRLYECKDWSCALQITKDGLTYDYINSIT